MHEFVASFGVHFENVFGLRFDVVRACILGMFSNAGVGGFGLVVGRRVPEEGGHWVVAGWGSLRTVGGVGSAGPVARWLAGWLGWVCHWGVAGWSLGGSLSRLLGYRGREGGAGKGGTTTRGAKERPGSPGKPWGRAPLLKCCEVIL